MVKSLSERLLWRETQKMIELLEEVYVPLPAQPRRLSCKWWLVCEIAVSFGLTHTEAHRSLMKNMPKGKTKCLKCSELTLYTDGDPVMCARGPS
jgi:hypothetical protein